MLLKASGYIFLVFCQVSSITILILKTFPLPNMDNSLNGDTSRSSQPITPTHSFNQSSDLLFSTSDHGKPSVLAQSASRCMEKMVRFSCHITFLVQCRNHDLLPNGLALKDPVRSSESAKILHSASMSLLKQQLKLSRTKFAQNKKLFDVTMSTLKELLNDTYYDKLLSFNISTSHRCHAEHLHKHKKKFQNLID